MQFIHLDIDWDEWDGEKRKELISATSSQENGEKDDKKSKSKKNKKKKKEAQDETAVADPEDFDVCKCNFSEEEWEEEYFKRAFKYFLFFLDGCRPSFATKANEKRRQI